MTINFRHGGQSREVKSMKSTEEAISEAEKLVKSSFIKKGESVIILDEKGALLAVVEKGLDDEVNTFF